MKLKRNERVALKVWINDSVFADEKWIAMTAVEGDSAYVFISDPGSSNTMKIKITEFAQVQPPDEKKGKKKKELAEKSNDVVDKPEEGQ